LLGALMMNLTDGEVSIDSTDLLDMLPEGQKKSKESS